MMDGVPADTDATRATTRRIRFLLDNHRLTVPEAARLLEMRPQVLQEVLDGLALPSDGLLKKISKHFGVDRAFLLGVDESSEPPAEETSDDSGDPPTSTGSRTLDVRTLATRYQALLELLIEREVITAAEYHEQITDVESRHR